MACTLGNSSRALLAKGTYQDYVAIVVDERDPEHAALAQGFRLLKCLNWLLVSEPGFFV